MGTRTPDTKYQLVVCCPWLGLSRLIQEGGKALVSAIQSGFIGQEDDAKMPGSWRLPKAAAMHHQDLLFHEEPADETLVAFFDVQPRKGVKGAPRRDAA